jgi:uncharacterized membrane protein YbhN (UPF0104 family)
MEAMIREATEKHWFTIRLLLALLIGTGICSAAAACWDRISGMVLDMNPLVLSLSLVCCIAYRVLNACGWSFVLRAFRQQLPTSTCVRIWLTAEACRWLPGSIWNYGSRAVQAKRAGLRSGVAAASVALELALTLAAWCLVAAFFLFLHDAWRSQLQLPRPGVLISIVASTAIVALMMIVLGRRWAGRWFSNRLNRVRSQLGAMMDLRPNGRWSIVALTYYVVMVLLQGMVLVCLSRALPFGQSIPSSVLVGANAVAWLIGFFAIMAPGGLVVREGGLAAILVAWVPLDQALAVAVVWRLLQMAAELSCLGAVYGLRILSDLRGGAARPGKPNQDAADAVEAAWVCVPQPIN